MIMDKILQFHIVEDGSTDIVNTLVNHAMDTSQVFDTQFFEFEYAFVIEDHLPAGVQNSLYIRNLLEDTTGLDIIAIVFNIDTKNGTQYTIRNRIWMNSVSKYDNTITVNLGDVKYFRCFMGVTYAAGQYTARCHHIIFDDLYAKTIDQNTGHLSQVFSATAPVSYTWKYSFEERQAYISGTDFHTGLIGPLVFHDVGINLPTPDWTSKSRPFKLTQEKHDYVTHTLIDLSSETTYPTAGEPTKYILTRYTFDDISALDYRNEMAILQATIDAQDIEIAGLESDIATLQTDITSLEADIAALAGSHALSGGTASDGTADSHTELTPVANKMSSLMSTDLTTIKNAIKLALVVNPTRGTWDLPWPLDGVIEVFKLIFDTITGIVVKTFQQEIAALATIVKNVGHIADSVENAAKTRIETYKTDLMTWLATNVFSDLMVYMRGPDPRTNTDIYNKIVSVYDIVNHATYGLNALLTKIVSIYDIVASAVFGNSIIKGLLDTLHTKVDSLITRLITDVTNFTTDLWNIFNANFSFVVDTKWNITATVNSILTNIFDNTFSITLPNTGLILDYAGIGTVFSAGSIDPWKHVTVTILGYDIGFYFLPYVFMLPIPDWIADWAVTETSGWTFDTGYPNPTTTGRIIFDILLVLAIVVIVYFVATLLPSKISTVISVLTGLFSSYTQSQKWRNLNEKLNFVVGWINVAMEYLLDPYVNSKPGDIVTDDLYDGDHNP